MFTVPNSTSPRSGLNAIIAMANTYLAQIADKVDRIDEQLLRNLDANVMKYVENRNAQRRPILEDLDTLTIENLNIPNLNLLHNESQCALLALQQELNQFEQVRESIQDQNNRALRDFVVATCGSKGMGVTMAGGQLTSRSGQYTNRSRNDNEQFDISMERVGEVQECQQEYIPAPTTMGNTTRNTTENTTRNTTTESNNSKAATTTSINSDDAILQLDLNQMNEKKRERKEEEGKLSPNFNLNLSAKKKDRNGKSGKVEKMSSFNSNGGMETGRNTERNSRKTMLDIVKELVIELSKYREIDDIVQEIQESRKKNKNFLEEEEGGDLVQHYIDMLDDVLSSDDGEEEDEHYYQRYCDMGNPNDSLSQLQYVQ